MKGWGKSLVKCLLPNMRFWILVPSSHVTKLGRILHIYMPSVVGAESGRSLKLLARQRVLGLVRDAVPKARKKLIKRGAWIWYLSFTCTFIQDFILNKEIKILERPAGRRKNISGGGQKGEIGDKYDQLYYICIWKCHNEAYYYVKLIQTRKKV